MAINKNKGESLLCQLFGIVAVVLIIALGYWGNSIKVTSMLLGIEGNTNDVLKEKIKECEKNLKHTEHCEIITTAVPKQGVK